MDYLRWLVLVKLSSTLNFDDVFAINALYLVVTFLSGFANITVALVLFGIQCLILLPVVYVYIERFWKRHNAEYKKFLNNNVDS